MQKKATRHMLILMFIYLVAFSQRWDETISFLPKKCIITRLFLWYLFFENFQEYPSLKRFLGIQDKYAQENKVLVVIRWNDNSVVRIFSKREENC
jgi:hypothetical protein